MGSLAIARLSVVETLRRREFYVVLLLVLGLALWVWSMDMSTTGAGRFAKDIVMQVTWLASFALAVPLAARQIPSDLEQRTVYVMMARSIRRWQYVLGKAAGASAAAIICFISFFLVLLFMMMTKGAANIADPSLWQAFALQIVALIMLCCIAVFLSVFGTSAGAITFSFLIFAIMRYGGPSIYNAIGSISGGLQSLVWGVYLALPHFEFFADTPRVVHEWGAIPTGIFLQMICYGILYSAAITAGTALIFRKRWL